MNRTIHLDKDKFELVKTGKKKFEIRLDNKIIKTAGYIESTKNLKYWSDKDINKLGLKIISLI
jgi:ASC-1-like (ASCH) protein